MEMSKHLEIGTMLNDMKQSVLYGANLKLIIGNSISVVDSTFNSYINLDAIDVLDVDWTNEMGVLNTLYTTYNDMTVNGKALADMTSVEISSVMTTASTADVATQVFGHIFNNKLADLLGAHNPVDASGNLINDYTDQAVLAANAANFGKLIDFGNSALDLYADPENQALGVAVGDYISSYDVAEGTARPTFADTYFPAIMAYANGIDKASPLEGIDMTKVDYSAEGQYFLSYYQETDPAVKMVILTEIYNNSKLTKAIMQSMGFMI
jgi:hypothetical protein